MKICGTVLPILVTEVTPDKPLSPGGGGGSRPNRVRPAAGHGARLCGAGHRVIWREHFAQGLRGGLAWGLRAGTSGASCVTPLWDAVGASCGTPSEALDKLLSEHDQSPGVATPSGDRPPLAQASRTPAFLRTKLAIGSSP